MDKWSSQISWDSTKKVQQLESKFAKSTKQYLINRYIKLDNGTKKEKVLNGWIDINRKRNLYMKKIVLFSQDCSPTFQRVKYVLWNEPSGLSKDIEMSVRAYIIKIRFS